MIMETLDEKLKHLKVTADGEFKTLITHLESVFHHVKNAPVEQIVKYAVATDLHEALLHVDNIANTTRATADTVDAAVDSVDDAVNKAVTNK